MKKAWNGESTFSKLCQRGIATGCKRFSQLEKEVHPGADRLKGLLLRYVADIQVG